MTMTHDSLFPLPEGIPYRLAVMSISVVLALAGPLGIAQDLPTDIEPIGDAEGVDGEVEYVHPADLVKAAFDAPPQANMLSRNRLWVDKPRQRVYVDGFVTMRTGPLEMLACPLGTKEHESVIATLAPSREVHAALLAVGAKPGTPVAFLPKFVPATGQRIRVWVCYRDARGDFQAIDARRWIQREGTDQGLSEDWVFGGSSYWTDPRDKREYYRADGGDLICVSNFATAMMDLPIASSAEASRLLYVPFTERIPPRETPVRLVLVPIPLPKDQPDPNAIDPDLPPTAAILPRVEEAGDAEPANE